MAGEPLFLAMPHKRPAKPGSFDAHFDELVKHFPRETPAERSPLNDRDLSEKRDIHALLFERAWQLERND